MNVEAFVSVRGPELKRFVSVLEHSSERQNTRLARPIPIRPLAVDSLSRRCSTSPFSMCPELDKSPRVPPTQKMVDGQQNLPQDQKCLFSLRRELHRIPKAPALRRLNAIINSERNKRRCQSQRRQLASKQQQQQSQQVKGAKRARRLFRRRLILRKRRGAKRAFRRRLAVTKTGFRLGMMRSAVDGSWSCGWRAYVPSHRFLSKRFSFGEIGAILRLNEQSSMQPWTSHHFSQFSVPNLPSSRHHHHHHHNHLPLRVTVPRASFTKKSFSRVFRARSSSSPTSAIFDLSFVASVQFVGSCASSALVPGLVQRAVPALFLAKQQSGVPRVVGDGSVSSLLEMFSATPVQHRRRLSAINMFGHLLVISIERHLDDGGSCVDVFFGKGPLGDDDGGGGAKSCHEFSPCLESAHHQKFSDNDDNDEGDDHSNCLSATAASCGTRSPFCMCLQGGNQQQQQPHVHHNRIAEAALRSAARALLTTSSVPSSVFQMSLAASIDVAVLTDRNNGSTFVFGLPFSESGAKLTTQRAAYSLQYQFFARFFRDAVVQHGAVPGGLEQF